MGVTMEKIQLYMHSLIRYGQSPFIYPIYGLGTLPEGFSRLCAIHGGTFMLNKPVKKFLYDNGGQVSGVETEDGDVRCRFLVKRTMF
jgi:Rab GDP dissociation inhibitor